jgi:hypothetical protein
MFDVHIKLSRFEAAVKAHEMRGHQTRRIVLSGSAGMGGPDLDCDFPRKNGSITVRDHSIDGITLEEQLYYYRRLIRDYVPRVLVIQPYENNRAAGYSVFEMMSLLSRICTYARTDIPGIKIYITDARPVIKEPCPDGDAVGIGAALLSHVKQFNQMLSEYAARYEDTTVISFKDDTRFFEDGFVGNYEKPRKELYEADGFHFNEAGRKQYIQLLTEALAPHFEEDPYV